MPPNVLNCACSDIFYFRKYCHKYLRTFIKPDCCQAKIQLSLHQNVNGLIH